MTTSGACPVALRGVLKGEGASATTAPKCTKVRASVFIGGRHAPARGAGDDGAVRQKRAGDTAGDGPAAKKPRRRAKGEKQSHLRRDDARCRQRRWRNTARRTNSICFARW